MLAFSRLKYLLKALPIAVALGGLILPFTTAQGQDGIGTIAVKRYFLARISARCHLLDDGTIQALKAGYLQSRNDALRAGSTMADLGPWLAKASAAADQAPCDAPQVTTEVGRAKGAFQRFMAVPKLDLPTPRSTWSADRSFGDQSSWRLVQYQNNASGDVALGIYGRLDLNSFSVMAHFKDGSHPYSARILVRNTDVVGIGLINPQPFGLTAQHPAGIDDSALSFLASNLSEASIVMQAPVRSNLAGFSLTGDYVGKQTPEDSLRFDFPTRAYIAIARLDPREDIVVEFECQDGPRYARFEVGDFITGLTYVALPSPYGQN